jgi:hypothetical protein
MARVRSLAPPASAAASAAAAPASAEVAVRVAAGRRWVPVEAAGGQSRVRAGQAAARLGAVRVVAGAESRWARAVALPPGGAATQRLARAARTPFESSPRRVREVPRTWGQPATSRPARRRVARSRSAQSQPVLPAVPTTGRGEAPLRRPERWGLRRGAIGDHPILERYNVSRPRIITRTPLLWKEPAGSPQVFPTGAECGSIQA